MENVHKLSFGQINILQANLAEVIVEADIEFNMAMIAEYHAWLLNHLQAPFGLLINKKNRYTYTFEAQMNLANLDEIQAMAVISYDRITDRATDTLIKLPRKAEWNIRVFSGRESALDWLHAQLRH